MFLLLALAGLTVAVPAHAQDVCPTDIPSICDTLPGGPAGSAALCDEICTMISIGGNSRLFCDLGARQDHHEDPHQSAFGVAVKNHLYGEGGSLCDGSYCIWGTDVTGANFFCPYGTDGGKLVEIWLKGGHHHDRLFFWYLQEGNPEEHFILQPYDDKNFEGRMTGEGGNDELQASTSTSSYYFDRIYGGPNDDRVCTFSGNDEGHGEGGADQLHCGNGDDLCSGGSGEDEVCDPYGTDVTLGGADDDTVVNGSFNYLDTLDGGGGWDTCNPGSCESNTSVCPF